MKVFVFFICAAAAFFVGSSLGERPLLGDEREGWEPIAVLTVARDLEGSLRPEDVVPLEVPRRFAHPGLVRASELASLSGKMTAPLPAGAPLSWSHLADFAFEQRVSTCTTAVAQTLAPDVEKAVDEAIASQSMTDAEPPPPSPPSSRDVLVVARAVAAGATLTDADLAALNVPPELLTASWIDASRRADVVGRRVVVALNPGEPVWWQMVEAPGSFAACVQHANAARDEARRKLAPAAARAWLEKAGAR